MTPGSIHRPKEPCQREIPFLGRKKGDSYMSSSKTYRVGLVGCGGMGRHHLEALKAMPEFETAALCDLFPEALGRSGEAFGVKARYTDFEKMYDEVKPDLVTVATQTRGHHAPTVAALKRGISVMCEKPIAIDLAEADEMVAASKASGAKLAIHQQNHVSPGIRKAQALVKEGLVGEVMMVRGRNKAGRQSGNEFMEMGTHMADMMLCFGGVPEWAAGVVYYQGRLAGPQDIMEAKEMSPKDRDSGPVMGSRAIGSYGFQGGILGEVHFLGYPKGLGYNYGVDVLGTEGQLAFRGTGALKENLWHLPRAMEGTPAQLVDWRPVDTKDVGTEEPILTMYKRLAQAMETGEEPPSNGEEGRWAFEMILGIYQSHREGGRRVALPMKDRRHPLEVWRREEGGGIR
ncbi:MAG: Gfo/Idh/MocA family oxidoreductase [Candidatus Latescibacteria bacterium]|nr:Gfo/Idh/MocA family oxidoreductase [Candidatus Latescibacterota bacterium]